MKYFLFAFFLFPICLFAQSNSKVLVRNAGIIDGKQIISVKWYSQDLLHPEGVNIYRKEGVGDWKKINSQPIKRLDSVMSSAYKKDQDLYFFVPLIQESKKEDLKGLMLFQVLVKSWESEVFSKCLDIQYDDTTTQLGKTYSYKINKIKGGSEYLLGLSNSIMAGPEIEEVAVKEIAVKTDTNKVKIKWKPEEQRFFAVNIYRSPDDRQWEKISNRPLVISKHRDTLGNLKYPEIFYVDDSLKVGVYYYQLTGVDFFGKETKRSQSVKVEIKDLIPPASPEELKDSINNLNVFLKWKNKEVKDVAGINVYRSIKSDGPFIKVNQNLLPSSTSQYQDKVEKAGPYYYYVASVDKVGNEGKSRLTFAEVHDIVPPSRPIGLQAKADTGKIVLTWQMNNETDLMGYRIYRTANKNDKNNFVLLNANPVKSNTFIDSLPASAKNKFLYKIIAVDSSYNKSEASEVVSLQMPDILPPVQPLIRNISNDEKSIIIYWISNKDVDLNGYNLYRGTDGDSYIKLNSNLISSSLTKFTDHAIESGKIYYYYLVALDSAENQSKPSDTQNGFNNFNSIIIPPQDVKLKYRADKKDIQITWSMVDKEEVMGYVIYRKQKESDELSPHTGKIIDNEYLDKDLKSGSTYYYQIRAYDKMGNIKKSELKKITLK